MVDTAVFWWLTRDGVHRRRRCRLVYAMRHIISLAIAGAVLASCQTPARVEGQNTIETHAAMVASINPAALAIAEVSDDARSETEGLDPTLMNDAAWSRIQGAAEALELSSRRMAEARTLRVGAHTAVEAGFATKREIQALIDADPEQFRALSLRMADQARDLKVAATARDHRRTRDLSQSLGSTCQTCHTRYWEKPHV